MLNKDAAAKPPFAGVLQDPETEGEVVFQTRFGGVFYLLNAGLFLGLYRDFTRSPATEIDLSIWDFVALSALEFLGEEIKNDPVWEFLRSAAQFESGDEFGHDFDQSRDWRIPLEWLATFTENGVWQYRQTGKRLVVRHPDGFNVIDIARRGDLKNQLNGEIDAYRRYFSGVSESRANPTVKSESWLKNLAGYLRQRFFQALNVAAAEDLNRLLFERRARVFVSPTHLEIEFALADLPLEVRFAGIDRDPGWIPAAGRYVYFHFV